ncbi:phosphopantothenate-cysteine ligase [Streptococcus rupicaprae]|uniref:Phosphopantothenate-cysteine ligase n=1 Tax=Streptococcus rupicaprae TaxID=759619 RepID=A0ABV2FGY3_9STRE
MKILITSGGTAEKIDQVRDITNKATGRLGQVMAEYLLAMGHEVSFVTSKHGLVPQAHPKLTTYPITNVQDLLDTLEPLVKNHDAIVHAMAVSDYTPLYMTDFETVAKSSDLTEFLQKSNQETKISSRSEHQVLFLKKTPKVISLVKEWNPAIQLIGFKLLVDVTKDHLIEVARDSLKKNQASAIVANDLLDIAGDQHLAYMVLSDEEKMASTKQEIAQLILEHLERGQND